MRTNLAMKIDPRMEKLALLPTETIDKLRAEKKMAIFLEQMWKYIDPHPYIHGWHIDAICEHMEAVVYGEIKRILINIPPRHMKSLGIAVGLPSWAWIKRPELQFLYSSYAHALSIRDGIKCRRVIQSPLYQRRWGDRFVMTSDQNTKVRFDNDKGGYRLATSVDGMTTGEGGDVIVIDDANNVNEAESDVTRTATNQWFDEVMQTRLNNPKTGAIVVIQQRTHANDLSGHIMKKYGDDYIQLKLPAEYERPSQKTKCWKGWTDPRKKEGELLWPERFGQEEIDKLKIALGPYAAAGQLQQRPSPREGGIIPIKSFKRYKIAPSKDEIIRLTASIDTAHKEDQLNDYSCIQMWGETALGHFLLALWRKKVTYPILKKTVKAWLELWRPIETIIEDKQSGTTLIQDLKFETKYPIYGMEPGSFSKAVRMENEASAIESGLVWLPEDGSNDWIDTFIDECSQFPVGDNDDQVDPMSQYLKRSRLRKQRGAVIVSPILDLQSQSNWRNI